MVTQHKKRIEPTFQILSLKNSLKCSNWTIVQFCTNGLILLFYQNSNKITKINNFHVLSIYGK